jgi:Flp pilus assembly protein TadD
VTTTSPHRRISKAAIAWYARYTATTTVVVFAIALRAARDADWSLAILAVVLLATVVIEKNLHRVALCRTWMAGFYTAIDHAHLVEAGRLPDRYTVTPPQPWATEPTITAAGGDR